MVLKETMFSRWTWKTWNEKGNRTLKKSKMSKIVFDSYLKPGDTIDITVYRENGTVEKSKSVVSDVYGNIVSIITEDS